MQTLCNCRDFQIGYRLAAMLLGVALLLPLTSPQPASSAPFTWSLTGSLGTARYDHIATRLADGRVLVAGGFNTMYTASAELFKLARGGLTSLLLLLGN